MNKLTKFEKQIIKDKYTEPPFSGKYYNFYEDGLYICKQCNTPLFKSYSKFNSNTGWPSFDSALNVKTNLEDDGRIEIVCKNCNGHLGHVFYYEQFTPKNTRYCVNSASLNFISKDNFKKAYFAGGCFWGVEYFFEEIDGVICAISGYMGSDEPNPTYELVCSKKTNYLEVVEVSYDNKQISYEELTKIFFEIHDPTQPNGQGPDIGPQYISAIFYNTLEEKQIAQNLIDILKKQGQNIVTKLIKNRYKFHKAEEYHQNYYFKKGQKPYCHKRVKRFRH